MTDHADLIRRLEEAASQRQSLADLLAECAVLDGEDVYDDSEHAELAALLREAAKALKGGE
jgi:hypothetical protein